MIILPIIFLDNNNRGVNPHFHSNPHAAVPATPESPQFSVTAADCDATMTADITVSWEYPPTTSEANVTTSLDGSPVAIGGTDEFPLISGVTLDTEHNVTIIASNSDGASDPVTLTFTLETQGAETVVPPVSS